MPRRVPPRWKTQRFSCFLDSDLPSDAARAAPPISSSPNKTAGRCISVSFVRSDSQRQPGRGADWLIRFPARKVKFGGLFRARCHARGDASQPAPTGKRSRPLHSPNKPGSPKPMSDESAVPPSVAQIRDACERLSPWIRRTPVWQCRGPRFSDALGPKTEVFLKLELFQFAGSFKTRGALCVMLALPDAALKRGVTAVSAGNHAMAVGYAAKVLGTTAKVVMPKTANPARVAGCKAFGAQVELVEDVHRAFDRVREIEAQEGRTFVHPFEGPLTALGTATLGYELCDQVANLDAVIVPIGGGGLCAGVSTAVKSLHPKT